MDYYEIKFPLYFRMSMSINTVNVRIDAQLFFQTEN